MQQGAALSSSTKGVFSYHFDQQPPAYTFHLVDSGSPKLKVVRKIFEEVIEPLYNNQERALAQIALSQDRVCYLLCEVEEPVGVIVFKKVLSDEFKNVGVRNSIEIKSLFVYNAQKNSGRGIGSKLLNKIIEEAKSIPGYESLHVTVSDTKEESLAFFRSKGFVIKQEWLGKYKNNVVEYLLARSAQIVQTAESVIPNLEQKLVRVIRNAHWGDIHALKLLPNGNIVSGSKDNSLFIWNADGERIKAVCEVEPTLSSEEDWITAVCILDHSEYWLSGRRNGEVTLWRTDGEYVKDIKLKLPKFGHYSLKENQRRVACLAAGFNPCKPSFFVGFPTMFDEYNLIEGRTMCSTFVHQRDWVYCIHPIADNHILTVVAGTLHLFEKNNRDWIKKKVLVEEEQKTRGTRTHIAALTPLKSSPQHYALGLFGGVVKVVDVGTGTLVKRWQEHEANVWAIENVAPHLFASSSQDRTIKLWDVRQDRSVCTIGKHVGEITAMLSPKEHMLIAGSHAPNSREGAQMLFYDFRK